jgi:hypothetical protein
MTTEKIGKQRYMVSVHEVSEAPGAFRFTFVPRGLQQERDVRGMPKRVPRHVLLVTGDPNCLVFDWTASPDPPEGAQTELEQIARDRLAARQAWLDRVGELVGRVEQWGKELDWATRRIEKRLEDAGVGTHTVPALLLQRDTVRVLLEPVSRRAPGAEGVVDLYRMPAYEDIASLYFQEGNWRVQYVFPNGKAVATTKEAEAKPLSKDLLAAVLQQMKQHGQ